MACNYCKDPISTGFKFCPNCGQKIELQESKKESLSDILETKILATELIYDNTDIINNFECKIKTLFPDSNNNFWKFFVLPPPSVIGYQNELDLNTDIAFNKKLKLTTLEYLSEKQYANIYSYSNYRFRQSEQRLCSEIPFLKMLNIKHTFQRYILGKNTKQWESLKDILIALIENRIKDPMCGCNLVGIINYDTVELYKKTVHDDEEKFRKENGDNDIKISLKKINRNDFNDKWEEYRLKPFVGKGDIKDISIDALNNHKLLIKREVCRNIKYIEMYNEVQKDLDKLLNKINIDLYYSNKNKQIYIHKDLSEAFVNFTSIFDINLHLHKHCELFQLRHINIYILNEELEELLYFSNLHKKINKINTRLTLRQDVCKSMLLDTLFGFPE